MVLTAATDRVLPDEKAFWLTESWQQTILGERRIQRIQVLRGDKIAVYESDMGPWNAATDFPFQAPSFWEYSVAELQEIAEQSRGHVPDGEEKRIDLVEVWAQELDEKRMERDHVSTFGPLVRKERR
jgi:hypothetical protein